MLLLKARKPVGEGTLKKYPSGLVYQKKGSKWVYYGKYDNPKIKKEYNDQAGVQQQATSTTVAAADAHVPYKRLDDKSYQDLMRQTTRNDRMAEGQEVIYSGTYHKHLTGQKGKLVAIGDGGFAMVQFGNGKVESAAWRDIKAVGPVKPYSLYDGMGRDDLYKLDDGVMQALHAAMAREIGTSGITYEALCKKFTDKGFTLLVVGGTVRDLLQKKDPKDIDFIVDCSDRELAGVLYDIKPSWAKGAVRNGHLGLVSFSDGNDTVDITPVHKFSTDLNDFCKGWNLKQDAISRDLSINTLQVDPLRAIMSDGTGQALKNIDANEINFNDEKLLRVNPIYLLRAFKFIARGFSFSKDAESILKRCIKYTENLPFSRRVNFLDRQIGMKDGKAGLEKYRDVFLQYAPSVWSSSYRDAWKLVYQKYGGKP